MYLLDTNTLIYFFKGVGKVADHLLDQEPANIFISSITLYELAYGIAKSNNPQQRQQQLSKFIDEIEVIGFHHKEATAAGLIRAKLEQKGTPIGPYDILIAATAVANNKILVTHNTKEFKRIKECKIEDWY
ncbi:MAG: type II toxin-antitoxin system VapC family toxin [Deltaproteobacteria bacterium]|nr:type II toxin-antitoxin system VapC family toxin [Deltaproteobacteria bacterium]